MSTPTVSLSLASKIVDAMYDKIENGVSGGTFSVDGKIVPDTGFFVGGAVPSLINPTRAQVIDFVETVGTDYVGFWEDTETNALYIDAVDWTASEPFARRLSILRDEIAYWDVKRSQEVRV